MRKNIWIIFFHFLKLLTSLQCKNLKSYQDSNIELCVNYVYDRKVFFFSTTYQCD